MTTFNICLLFDPIYLGKVVEGVADTGGVYSLGRGSSIRQVSRGQEVSVTYPEHSEPRDQFESFHKNALAYHALPTDIC